MELLAARFCQRRPELDEALDYLRPGDVFVITRLSRAARSLRHLLDLAAQLREREVDLLVLKQGIDTSTPSGRLQFHMFGAFDEFLRELIVEGTLERPGFGSRPRPRRWPPTGPGHSRRRDGPNPV
ncbi:recombinase family protein [Nonomuraea sp. B19D2]|uniref:recombinase family protein n=1 Tax=Nonomuraea sp. B19D2 TaxID=3159561 RepID=UPI0032DB8B65